MSVADSLPDTISLIGMPGAGKSTIGVILAKLGGLRFADTDLDIQVHANATLQEIVDNEGYLRLREIEQEILLAIPLDHAIVATGGSVVYSEPIMTRLKGAGPVVYLEADLPTLQQRVAATPRRGIACAAGQGYPDIFAERTPLYRRYADITVDACGGTPEEVAEQILKRITPTR